jgi:hypothetical protein
MIDQLIKENRKLQRQIVKLTAVGTAATGRTVERGLRTIQRRVQRALDGAQPRRRRTSTTRTGTRARTTPRTRRASPRSGSSSS